MVSFLFSFYVQWSFLIQIQFLQEHLKLSSNQIRAAKNIFHSGSLGNEEKIVCEMKVLFTIAYIRYTIGLQLYLLKKSIDKVTESGFQAIKVSGDDEK